MVFYPHFDLVVTVQSAPYRYRYRGESNGICPMPPLPRRLHGHRSYGPATARMTPLPRRLHRHRLCCPATAGTTPPPFIEKAILEGGAQGSPTAKAT